MTPTQLDRKSARHSHPPTKFTPQPSTPKEPYHHISPPPPPLFLAHHMPQLASLWKRLLTPPTSSDLQHDLPSTHTHRVLTLPGPLTLALRVHPKQGSWLSSAELDSASSSHPVPIDTRASDSRLVSPRLTSTSTPNFLIAPVRLFA